MSGLRVAPSQGAAIFETCKARIQMELEILDPGEWEGFRVREFTPVTWPAAADHAPSL